MFLTFTKTNLVLSILFILSLFTLSTTALPMPAPNAPASLLGRSYLRRNPSAPAPLDLATHDRRALPESPTLDETFATRDERFQRRTGGLRIFAALKREPLADSIRRQLEAGEAVALP
ncbi:hypothetical protein FA15DRAFT_671271 [Coprinopsis marcescibilis]|uniref:Uncharacterized protein n=1 Tax=Coprinopsis marcescibilis TaxID=230819 RepID=A0A5C3KQY4_COPMA|nr:hypothetical protein FA15DRAFT_671271 [Coprinopsis marcescibilis]